MEVLAKGGCLDSGLLDRLLAIAAARVNDADEDEDEDEDEEEELRADAATCALVAAQRSAEQKRARDSSHGSVNAVAGANAVRDAALLAAECWRRAGLPLAPARAALLWTAANYSKARPSKTRPPERGAMVWCPRGAAEALSICSTALGDHHGRTLQIRRALEAACTSSQ